jgi:hypothetical protein
VPALPTPPTRQFSFTDYSTNYPTQPPPGDKLDAEFDRINTALGQVIQFTATLFQPDGTLKPGSVPPEALTTDLAAALQTINTAALTLEQDNALKWAEYLAGPVISAADAPAAIASSAFPNGLFYDAIQGGSGGLYSAKYWALQAMVAAAKFTALYGAPSPAPTLQIVRLTPWTFTNSGTSFPLTRLDNAQPITPDQNALIVVLNGYVQTPGVDYTVAASTITFAQAPYANEPHFAVWLSPQAATTTVSGNLDAGAF